MKKFLMGIFLCVFSCVMFAQGIVSPGARELILSIKKGEWCKSGILGAADDLIVSPFCNGLGVCELQGILRSNQALFINLSRNAVRVGGVFSNGVVKQISDLVGTGICVFELDNLFRSFESFVFSSGSDIRVLTDVKNKRINFVWINVDSDGLIEFEYI